MHGHDLASIGRTRWLTLDASELPGASQRVVALSSIAAGAVLLLSAAAFNGFPLTFWDTRAYVEHAGTLLPRPDRLVGYSVLIRALGFERSLWPMVVAQSLVLAALLWRTLRALAGAASPAAYLLLMSFLTVATALPWISGQVMPDVFTPMLVLALFLLLEVHELTCAQRVALCLLVASCVGVHLTHLPLGLALLAGAFAVTRSRRVLAPLLALLLGLSAIGGFNHARSGRFTLAAGGDAFLLGHLVDSGIASRLLAEHCPERGYLLCAQRAQLPMSTDDLLWVDRLDLQPWQHTTRIAHETQRLLHDSLREYPGLHLRVALDYTLRELLRFRTGEGLDADAAPLIEPQIARYAPLDLPAYRAARQQRNAIPVARLRGLHTPVAALLLLLGLALLVLHARGRGSDPSLRFLGFVYWAVLVNAALSGNLSGLYDRYQSRLVWLVAVGVFAYLMRRLTRPASGDADAVGHAH